MFFLIAVKWLGFMESLNGVIREEVSGYYTCDFSEDPVKYCLWKGGKYCNEMQNMTPVNLC